MAIRIAAVSAGTWVAVLPWVVARCLDVFSIAACRACRLSVIVLLSLTVSSPRALAQGGDAAAPPHDAGPAAAAPSPEEEHRIEELRKEADATLLRGEFDRARREFEEVLKLAPGDASAQRDAARAAQAAGQLEYAVKALENAHHLEGHTRDPELHYLRGEALFVLGREDEARREQRIAELEIGPHPTDRMEKLWLARIYARRGYFVLADRLYETLWPPAPKADAEVAINQADAHLMNQDWAGAVNVLRRHLEREPKNVRAREMLAWALEVTGDLDGELDVRRGLAADVPTPLNHRDYGRALERAADFGAARVEYQSALGAGSADADGTLATAIERMTYRTTPELAGGFSGRADPQASALRAVVGGALPIGRRDTLSLVGWRDESRGGFPPASGSVTGLGAAMTLVNRPGALLIFGADARYASQTVSSNGIVFSDRHQMTGGAQGELDAPLWWFAQLNVHADLNEQWAESPITVQEGGVTTGATGHFFLFPRDRSLLLDAGAQVRRLSLAPREGDLTPRANQTLLFIGGDVILWSNPARILRGEVMDDRMVRRSYLSDAGILSYRHYQLFSDSEPDFAARIAIAPRAAIHNGSFVFRKVLATGRAGLDLRGGVGYDTERNRVLSQGGISVLITPSWASRISLSYDVSRETATGLSGTLQTGWVTYHADL